MPTIRPKRIAIVIALSLAGLALTGGLALPATAAPAQVFVYPGADPCNTTLQACISAAGPGDEVRVLPAVYNEALVITESVSLVRNGGSGTVVLQAPPGQRVLTISGTVTSAAQIAHLTIQGAGLASGNGAGILVLAPAQPSLHDLIIQNNTVTAATGLGGGLFTESPLTLTNVTFRNNLAFAGSGGGLAGAPGAHLILNNVTFDGNAADQRGGGLFANSAVISGSTFHLNLTGVLQGGGAYLTATAVITNSLFERNEARHHGGGLYTGDAATINGSLFRLNHSLTESAGAVYALGKLFIAGSIITGSTSYDSGGAVFAQGPLTMFDTLVAENISTGGSGAGVRANSTAVISNTQFISNTAFNPGGGLRVTLGATLHNTDFISNISGGSGGGLRTNADAAITGGSFVANSGTAGGGALIAGTATVSQTVFRGNTASVQGGGLNVVTATVQSAVFDDNEVTAGNGGGLHALSVLALGDSLFTANRVLSGTQANATGSGGGLFSDGVLTSTGNTFIGNFAFRLGGGADVDDTLSQGDVFRGNLTGPQGSGGGMFVAGVFVVDSGQFFTNTANTAGGLGVNSTARGEVFNSLFARNVVTFTDGGAAMRLLSSTYVTLTHNTLVGNNQASRAAVHMQGSGDFWFYANIIASHAQGLKQFGTPPTSTVTVEHTLFQSVTTPYIGPITAGGTNITGTAAFFNPAADNYHLGLGSLALDAAPDYGLAADFEGHARPLGLGFDLGFDEAQLPLWLPLILR